jgi:putative DNA primase/helicase
MIRRMMQEFVEVTPEFKLTISGNYKPEVRGADDGIWSRILLVPFDQQIPKDEIDRQLPEKLWSERAGVLAWLVEGLLEYMANGLQVPAEILAATDEYRQDSDPLRVFLTSPEFCDITGNPDHFTKSRDLTDAFLAYLIEAGTSPWGRRTVSNQLKTRSANIKTEEGAMFTFAKRSDTGYRGIKLGPKALELRKEYEDKLGRLS